MNVLVKAVAMAATGLAVLLAAGCATSRPAPAKGSVQACIAFGVRAIDEHRTVTQVPRRLPGAEPGRGQLRPRPGHLPGGRDRAPQGRLAA